jgi:uncharacterized LabA/DUF88 family protein
MNRVMVFIDGSNLYFACRTNQRRCPWDVVTISRDLAGPDRELIRVYYYNARGRQQEDPEKYAREGRFYSYLEKLDYCTVRLGRVEGRKGNVHQKGVDTLLVQDLLTLAFAQAFDVAVVVSEDGDFASVIEEVKSMGKQVEVAFLGRPGHHLRAVCDRYVDMLKGLPTHFPPLSRGEPAAQEREDGSHE